MHSYKLITSLCLLSTFSHSEITQSFNKALTFITLKLVTSFFLIILIVCKYAYIVIILLIIRLICHFDSLTYHFMCRIVLYSQTQ